MPDYGAHLQPGMALRQRTAADLPFLEQLYESSRQDELRDVPWSQEEKRAFLRDQFSKQHQHYLLHYPRAQWYVIERDGAAIGRFYIEQTASEIRLMDISLLPQWRSRGIGSTLMRALIETADTAGLPIGLHVEPFNRALRLYERLGFETVETRGVYLFMKRPSLQRA